MNKRTHPREYQSWRSARNRCFNSAAEAFPYYGGRGISMCDRWRESFAAFVQDMGARPPSASLERIDNDGDYEPANCRWASKHDQMRNRRSNVLVRYQDQTYVLRDLATELNVSYKLLHRNYSETGDIERAIDTTLQTTRFGSRGRLRVAYAGEVVSLKDVARMEGVPYSILHYHHRRKGLPLGDAVAASRLSKAKR